MTNLFISYYKATTPERQAEIDYCLKTNCENPLIDRIIIATGFVLPMESDKFIVMVAHENSKPTYERFISAVNHHTGDDDVNIIANADIIFDGSLSNLDKLKANDCWALSRWEMNSKLEKIHRFNRLQIYGDSQDVWIFRGKIKPIEYSSFELGVRGCDNRIAYEIHKAGYKISNPSNTIHTWHYHISGVRNYIPAQGYAIPEPYLNVPVTSL